MSDPAEVDLTPDQWLAEAKRRYSHDAMFHNTVNLAVQVAAEDVRTLTGLSLERHERIVMHTAAAVAMVIQSAKCGSGTHVHHGHCGMPGYASPFADQLQRMLCDALDRRLWTEVPE